MKEPSLARSWLLSAALCLGISVWCGDGTGVPSAIFWLLAGLLSGAVALNGGRSPGLEKWGMVFASLLLMISVSFSFLKSSGVHLEATASVSAHPWFFIKTVATACGIGSLFCADYRNNSGN